MDQNVEVWWKKPVRVLQLNVEDPYGAWLDVATPQRIVELAKRIRANVIVVFYREPWGRVLNAPTSLVKHPKVDSWFRELVERAHANNIRVVAMVAHTTNRYIALKHSDWLQVNYRGEPILLEHIPSQQPIPETIHWPLVCINSPFIDVAVTEVREAIEAEADGVLLDSFRYQPDLERACYCKWCTERFRREHGFEPIREANWADSRWRTLWNWRYKVVVEALRKLRDVAKSLKKDAVFMYNSHPAGWAGRANRVVELARDIIDVVFAECSECDHQPPGFITEMAKLSRAMSGGKPVWISRNSFHMYRTPVATTPLAIKQGLREAIVGGASPWVLVFSSMLEIDQRFEHAVAEVFAEVEKLEPYIDGAQPIKFAALLFSNKTNDMYGRNDVAKYVDEVRGFYYAATYSHIPIEYIADTDLENGSINGFRLLILANAVCMDDSALKSITRFVESGGRIVATYLTSYMDSEGIERFELGLGDLLEISLKSIIRSGWHYIDIVDQDLYERVGTRHVLIGDMSYTYAKSSYVEDLGSIALVRPKEGRVKVLANAALAEAYGYEYTLRRSAPYRIASTDIPSIIESSAGIYVAFQLGRMFWRTGLPEFLEIIRFAIERAGGAPPITIHAPETVEAGFYTKRDLVIVHLLNHSYNQRILARGIGKTRQPLPGFGSDEAVHPIREVVPVHNIEIVLNLDIIGKHEVLRAYSPLTDSEFEVEIRNGYAYVRVPLLEEFESVVIEPKY
ncbi:MAG TPA: hypothetical protein EYH02_05350 [Ignisphaera aggregans]|uniref:Beta-galactosidase trimerisation domain-containing protein n=1 Tax=Ignisphaera aggregans TaxID=334771 RepID=A0A833DV36_9CREN|nr:hypothetical protein [Ignisphaera aggregans]